MVKIDLKGVAKATAKGRTYYYAWRGGPRLRGEPGSPEFIVSYHEAHDNQRQPDNNRFRSLVVQYKADPAFKTLAQSTRAEWARWLDRISEHFGKLRIAQFDRPSKIRPIILRWRNSYAKTPRAADYGIQVLSRVLSHAVETGKIASNPCEGIKSLYKTDRSEIIWTDADITNIQQTCSPQISQAIDLAAATGLRRGDLLRLSWSHVDDDAISITTSKSRHRREAIIPLYDHLRDILNRIPKRSTTILTSSRGRPWTGDGFNSSFTAAMKRAGMGDAELNFNDLRGTAATRFYNADLPMRVIAEILAWDEDHVERIIRRYVGRAAATRALIKTLNEAKRRT
jgi:integrase